MGAGACLAAVSWNAPHGAATGAAFVLERLGFAGWPAALYLLAAMGAGRLARPLWRGSQDGAALQLAAGLAFIFFVSHLLAWLGVWRAGGQWLALAVLGIPALAAVLQGAALMRGRGWEPRLHTAWLPGFAAVGVAIAAACQPPGWLWGTEFGGYDALSYHLMLPQEWLAKGRLTPLPHNVYSFLPGYFESAFFHLAVAMGAPARPGGMVLDAGYPVYAAQLLHAGVMLAGAWLISRLARRAGDRCGLGECASGAMGAAAGALALVTPWTVVTGSLAYNEMAMVSLLAGAMLASWDPSLTTTRRGVVVGLLLGAAASVKPTAFVLGFPAVALMLATSVRPRQWPLLGAAAAAAGLVVMAPWLIRNFLAAGNPVFPFASALFAGPSGSSGHWSREQLSRYSAAHHFSGPLADRLRLVFFPDPHDPAGIRQRGVLHPQWGILFPVAVASLVAALLRRPAHRAAAMLLGALTLQLLAWLWLTHIQSRFLMPLLPLGCVAAVLGIATLRVRSLRIAATAGVLVIQAVLLGRLYGEQRGGTPAAALAAGVELRTGDLFRTATESERREFLASCHPTAFANLALPPGEGLALIGGAAPLYFTRPVMYATTWDSTPLAQAMSQHPNDPAEWSAALRRAGATYALVEVPELERLRRSGTLDPALEPARVTRWLEQQTTLIRSWPQAGVYLVRVSTPASP